MSGGSNGCAVTLPFYEASAVNPQIDRLDSVQRFMVSLSLPPFGIGTKRFIQGLSTGEVSFLSLA